jgi:hypothetical protein
MKAKMTRSTFVKGRFFTLGEEITGEIAKAAVKAKVAREIKVPRPPKQKDEGKSEG